MSDRQDSHPPDRVGRDAILFFEVTGPDSAAVVVAVEHRDAGDCLWSGAGSLSMSAPAGVSLRVSALKDEVRCRFDVVRNPGDGQVEVRVLPPQWLPH